MCLAFVVSLHSAYFFGFYVCLKLHSCCLLKKLCSSVCWICLACVLFVHLHFPVVLSSLSCRTLPTVFLFIPRVFRFLYPLVVCVFSLRIFASSVQVNVGPSFLPLRLRSCALLNLSLNVSYQFYMCEYYFVPVPHVCYMLCWRG